MKIIQISTFFHPITGGVESHVLNLSRQLEKDGHEVIVLTSNSSKKKNKVSRKETDYLGIEVRRFRSWFSLSYYHKFFPGILRYLLSEDYDLIHVHGLRKNESYLALLVAKIRRKPIVLTTHNPFPTVSRSTIAELFIKLHDYTFGKMFLRSFSSIITLVPSEKEKLIRMFGVAAKRIVEVPNAVEDLFFSKGNEANFYKEWGISADKWDGIVVWVGRASYAKGLQNLKMAVRKLKNVLFFFAGGDDGYLPYLRQLYQDSPNVVFSERFITPDKQLDMYAAADVSVLPSLHEAFGIVILESLAQGISVLSTNRGGPAEIFAQTDAVKLIDPENQADWKMSIEAIVKNKVRQETLSKNGKEFAEKYTWDKVTKRIIEVYEKVVTKNKDI